MLDRWMELQLRNCECQTAAATPRALCRGAKLLNARNPGCPVYIHENQKSVMRSWKNVGTKKTVACKDCVRLLKRQTIRTKIRSLPKFGHEIWKFPREKIRKLSRKNPRKINS